ncbi:hypothetical protein [Streptomyces sp. NPDC060205]
MACVNPLRPRGSWGTGGAHGAERDCDCDLGEFQELAETAASA